MKNYKKSDYKINFELFGILEWLNWQGSTITKFNEHVIVGNINGIRWRYFISDGFFVIMDKRYGPSKKRKAWYYTEELINEFEMLFKEKGIKGE